MIKSFVLLLEGDSLGVKLAKHAHRKQDLAEALESLVVHEGGDLRYCSLGQFMFREISPNCQSSSSWI
ncbi:MAG TPA: hypothetical protein VK902_15110 [Rubrobacter sp.]|nr:hypothetical protein [Rubrobacter sp.]